MTQEKIIDGNKLIAEFINLPFKTYGGTGKTFYMNGNPVLIPQLKYHSSWDWLMPVWFKFRDMKINFKEHEYNKNINWFSMAKDRIANEIINGTINSAFIMLVKEIKEYNKINNFKTQSYEI